MEEFVTGYCRAFDGARTVLAEPDERCADCDFPDCIYRESCQIAARLSELFA